MSRVRARIVFLLLILILLAVSILASLLTDWLGHSASTSQPRSSGSSSERSQAMVGDSDVPGTRAVPRDKVEVSG